MSIRFALACIGAALLAACETMESAPPPPEAALANIAPDACTAQFTVASAIPLATEEPSASSARTAQIDAMTPCVIDANGRAARYVVFALPSQGAASVLAGSRLEDRRLLAPRVVTLDGALNVVRTFEGEALQDRGLSYVASFRPRGSERYVAVVTNADLVGQSLSFVAGDPASVPIAPHIAAAYGGEAAFRARLTRAFSFEGGVIALVYFSEPAAAGSSP